MYFEFSSALILFCVLPALFWIMKRGEQRTAMMAAIYKGKPPHRRYYRARYMLTGLFFGSMVMVAARPYIESGKSSDVLFLVDVSRSMEARHTCGDMTFLDRAKDIMRDVLIAVPEARFGIFAFDRFAFPITHLTRDRSYLNEVINEGVHIGLTFQATRTELANALGVIARKKTRLPQIYGNVTNLILLSDGHIGGDYTRGLGEPLQLLHDAGIKVLTVGVGNPGETPIMNMDRDQCTNEFIEMDGKVVNIPLRDDILKHIASETNGQFFSEGDKDSLIRLLREGLAQADPKASIQADKHRSDISQVFMLIGTLSLLALLVLGSGLKPVQKFLA